VRIGAVPPPTGEEEERLTSNKRRIAIVTVRFEDWGKQTKDTANGGERTVCDL